MLLKGSGPLYWKSQWADAFSQAVTGILFTLSGRRQEMEAGLLITDNVPAESTVT